MKILCLSMLLMLTACNSNKILLRDYFPSEVGTKYTYTYINNNKTGSTETILTKIQMKNRPDVFCYVAPDEVDSPNPTLASYNFLEGIFKFSGNKILISPRFTLLEPDTASIYNQFQPFFKRTISLYDSIIIKVATDIIYTYKIAKHEEIKTPVGDFYCIKIDYTRYDLVPMNMRGDDFILYNGVNYPAFSRSASAWLAKDVGMVKWERFTGRVDLLQSYSKK